MTEDHANISLLKHLDLRNLDASRALFTQDAVWHYFNPRLPDIQGDYVGVTGVRSFFERIQALTEGTFQVEPISMTPIGDELVVTHTKNRMTLQGQSITTDVVVVWRIVDGRIAEVWDIPSVYSGISGTHG